MTKINFHSRIIASTISLNQSYLHIGKVFFSKICVIVLYKCSFDILLGKSTCCLYFIAAWSEARREQEKKLKNIRHNLLLK